MFDIKRRDDQFNWSRGGRRRSVLGLARDEDGSGAVLVIKFYYGLATTEQLLRV